MITSSKIIGEGIAYDVYARQEPDVKRGHPAFIMSRSELTNFASNPKRWLDGYKVDDDDTTATIFGSLVETLAGLNGSFNDKYAVAPAEYEDEKTGKMKPWNWNAGVCKQWREDQGEGVEVIKSELHSKAEEAHQALCADDDVCQLFQCSKKQVMVVGVYKSGEIEIPLRCLLDLVPLVDHPIYRKTLSDFKTARNGCPDIWGKVTADSGYDVQAALSMDLYCAATGEDRDSWLMPVQENVPPYHVVKPMPMLSVEFIAWGRLKYQTALAHYAHSLKTGDWPSYSTSDRLVLTSPACQVIDPKSVYAYRESAGHGHLSDFEPERKQPAQEQNESVDITP